jgi:hypothetical protein
VLCQLLIAHEGAKAPVVTHHTRTSSDGKECGAQGAKALACILIEGVCVEVYVLAHIHTRMRSDGKECAGSVGACLRFK